MSNIRVYPKNKPDDKNMILAQRTIKSFVEFLTIEKRTEIKEVESRNPADLVIPNDCVCFSFFDQDEFLIDGQLFQGQRKNHSQKYFVNCDTYDVDQALDKYPQANWLLKKIKDAGYNKILIAEEIIRIIPFADNNEVFRNKSEINQRFQAQTY